jgi:cytochrome c oxidase assembly protein subunit 15
VSINFAKNETFLATCRSRPYFNIKMTGTRFITGKKRQKPFHYSFVSIVIANYICFPIMNAIQRKIVGTWLLIGCAMVFFQVIVGGVTRLTESGLSITEWKPVKGIVPPLNETEWKAEFELYKNMTQFKTVNQDMTVSEFKWIYFWEYFHRFWARFMGLVFIIPFAFFVLRKWLDKDFFRKIGVLFLWGGLIGIYGWIMVYSGLRGMYVPPIHLSIHLILALALFAYLVWLTIDVYRGGSVPRESDNHLAPVKKILVFIVAILFLQIFMGGIVSGMKAGLAYPTWPDMNRELVPTVLFTEPATSAGFTQYNAADAWGRTFIQFFHRLTAYILLALVMWYWLKARTLTANRSIHLTFNFILAAVLLQAFIGIMTVLNCVGKIPVGWGVIHQAGAMVLISAAMLNVHQIFSGIAPKE